MSGNGARGTPAADAPRRPAGRILVVDDMPETRELLRLVLEKAGHEILLAADGEEGVELAIRGRPDVIVLDVCLPGKSGFEVCRELQALGETATIPIVFLTANSTGEEDHLHGLELGGFDYLVKPVSRDFLLARIAVMLRIRRSEEEIRRLAMIDDFTGLYTRKYVLARVDEEIDRATRRPTCFTLAMIDLDDFKLANDRFGHLFGDSILKRVAEILRSGVRGYDAVGRFGGEEFLLLQPDLAEAEAARSIERLQADVAAARFVKAGSEGSVTFSAGVAAWQVGLDGEALLERADTALYAAKGAGKGRTVCYSQMRGDSDSLSLRG